MPSFCFDLSSAAPLRPKSADPAGSAGRKVLRGSLLLLSRAPDQVPPRLELRAAPSSPPPTTARSPLRTHCSLQLAAHETAPYRTAPHCIVARGVYPALSTHPSTPVWVDRNSTRHSAHSPAASCELLTGAATMALTAALSNRHARTPAGSRSVMGSVVGWVCACQCSLLRATRAPVHLPAHTPNVWQNALGADPLAGAGLCCGRTTRVRPLRLL